MRIGEALGRIVGGIWAPWAALGSLARNARLFHPDGVVYWAHVEPITQDGMYGEFAQRLRGPALVRLSSSWWRGEKEWPDILGIAMRFVNTKSAKVQPATSADQDLLFVTVRRSLLFPFAPFLTNTHDFLANDYHALLPFAVDDIGRVKLRLKTMRIPTQPGKRRDKLAARVEAGTAVLRIEMRPTKLGAKWREVATIDIREKAVVDQKSLAFHPFRSGRGIVPVGAIQMIRAAVYPASALGRQLIPK
jgi:hypothetical protein